MTKKHFVQMAELVRQVKDGTFNGEPASFSKAVFLAEAFMTLAKRNNLQFDAMRFMAACGLVKQGAEK